MGRAMSITQVGDTLEIQRLLAHYARAVDAKDWELYRSLFTADAQIDYSSAMPGMVGARDEIVKRLSESLEPLETMMHYITNIEVDLSGDTAQVRAMFYNPLQVPGFDQMSCCGGYYHHAMVRTEDGWRSRELREETVWFANPPVLE
jgi:SnoaL-like domain